MFEDRVGRDGGAMNQDLKLLHCAGLDEAIKNSARWIMWRGEHFVYAQLAILKQHNIGERSSGVNSGKDVGHC